MHTHAYTYTQMDLDGCHMLVFADVSVCLCSWGWYASGTTVCLFDFYLVVLTHSLALKVLPFCCLSGHWYWCQGDMHQKSNSPCILGLALDSEYGLETQTLCLSVNKEDYLERAPWALQHSSCFLSRFSGEIYYVVNILPHSLNIRPLIISDSVFQNQFKPSYRPHTVRSQHITL